MNVRVELELASSPTEADIEEISASARHLTNNKASVAVYAKDDHANSIVAEFTINKARQGDVVDGIGRKFRSITNNIDTTIFFPKTPPMAVQKSKPQYTYRQGQYLAFIHYYIKLNRRPPSEADIQRYVNTTPPTVHNMIIMLEKKGFIERKPNVPRSIKLLLSADELPDLE